MEALRFGLSRSHGGSSLVDGAHRFAAALGGALGRTVKVVVAADYDRLLRSLLDGAADLGWLPPLVQARADPDRLRLIGVSERGGRQSYRSALLVAAHAPVRALADLARVRAAWTDRDSASGYLLPRLHLLRGIDESRAQSERFYGSSSAACAAVADGSADLCACFVSEAAAGDPARMLAEVQASFAAAPWRLRVLDVTASIPADGMMAPPELPNAEAVRNALLGLHLRDDGREALRTLLHADRIAPATVEVEQLLARLRASLP